MATKWSPLFVNTIFLRCWGNVIYDCQTWAVLAASIARIEPDNILNAVIVIVQLEL